MTALCALAVLWEDMKSGPKELQAYHELVLRAERNHVTVEQQQAHEKGNMDVPGNAPSGNAPANGAVTGGTARQRSRRSDAGKSRPKVQPAPGTVAVRFECSVGEAHDLLGYMLRTGKTAVAHHLVDALAKAQRNGE